MTVQRDLFSHDSVFDVWKGVRARVNDSSFYLPSGDSDVTVRVLPEHGNDLWWAPAGLSRGTIDHMHIMKEMTSTKVLDSSGNQYTMNHLECAICGNASDH